MDTSKMYDHEDDPCACLDLPGLVLPPSPASLCSLPSPLHLYVLAAPSTAPAYLTEAEQHPADTNSRSFLLAAAELLLVPSLLGTQHGASPLATELHAAADQTISVLASKDGAAFCDLPQTAANRPASASLQRALAVPLRVRVQAWEQHLQPLLCDLGLILVNMPHIATVMAKQLQHGNIKQQHQQQQVLDWLSLWLIELQSIVFEEVTVIALAMQRRAQHEDFNTEAMAYHGSCREAPKTRKYVPKLFSKYFLNIAHVLLKSSHDVVQLLDVITMPRSKMLQVTSEMPWIPREESECHLMGHLDIIKMPQEVRYYRLQVRCRGCQGRKSKMPMSCASRGCIAHVALYLPLYLPLYLC
eukprot:1137055-Pelagomonas_calceolata.AAC.2